MPEQDKSSIGQVIIKNILSLSGANLIVRLLGFITTTYLARILGAEGFGILNFSQAFISYFVLLSDAGLKIIGTREIARNRELYKKYVNNIFTLQFILSIVSYLILLLILWLCPPKEYVSFIAVLGLSILPSVFYFDWFFKGIDRMEIVGIAQILKSAVYLALVFLFINNPMDLGKIPWLVILSSVFLLFFVTHVYLKNHGKYTLEIDLTLWKRFITSAVVLGFSNIMGRIYTNFDSVLLGLLISDEAVGYYSAAYKIILVITSFSVLFFNGLFPSISRFYINNDKRLEKLLRVSVKVLTSVAIPMGIGGSILAEDLISLIYGNKFSQSILPFQILIWAVVFIYINKSYSRSLIAFGKEKPYTAGVTIGALMNISLNIFIIPRFGLAGAAGVTVLTELFILIYMKYHFSKELRIALLPILIYSVFSGIIMGVLLILVKAPVIIEMIIGALLYTAVFYLIGGLSSEDKKIIKMLLRRDHLSIP